MISKIVKVALLLSNTTNTKLIYNNKLEAIMAYIKNY